MRPCGDCGPDTEPEDAVLMDSSVEASGCTDVETVSSWNSWEECSAESELPV